MAGVVEDGVTTCAGSYECHSRFIWLNIATTIFVCVLGYVGYVAVFTNQELGWDHLHLLIASFVFVLVSVGSSLLGVYKMGFEPSGVMALVF